MSAPSPGRSPELGLRVRRAGVSAPYRVAAGVLAATALDVAVDPVHTHIPLCPFHALTGWWCPLCGSLRAVDQLARGHLASAVHDNLLLVAATPLACALWCLWVADAGGARRLVRRHRAAARAAAVVVLVAFTVLRNLPFAAGLRP